MDKKIILSYFRASSKDWQDWRWQFKNRITKITQLEYFFGKPALQKENLTAMTSVYPLAITPYYLSLIQSDNPNDPIFSQCVPSPQEISYSDRVIGRPSGRRFPHAGTQADTPLSRPLSGHRY